MNNTNREYELQFEIENRCLLNCIHCSSLDMRRLPGRTYSDDSIIEFVSNFHMPVHIYFTGGDPILYDNLLTLCQRVNSSKSNAEIGLYTTGNCINLQPISEDYALELVHSGVRDCYMSIYSASANEQDKWTNTPGSYKNTIISVNRMYSAGIQPKAHLVLSKLNYQHIDELIHFCVDIGFSEVRILKLTPSGNAQNHWSTIGLPSEFQNEIIQDIIKRRDSYNVSLSFSGYPQLHPCRSFKAAKKCQAGTNLLYITLSGDVYPCACTLKNSERYKIGNISNMDKVFKVLAEKYSREYNDICLNELK